MKFKLLILTIVFSSIGFCVFAISSLPAVSQPPLPVSSVVLTPVSSPSPSVAPETNSVFCEKFSGYLDKISSAVNEKFANINSKREEISQKLDKKENDLKEKINESRDKRNQNRDDLYSKLEEKAKTDSQKQALTASKTRIEAAVLKRRTAIDLAIKEYQDGVKKIIADRKAKADGLSTAYENALEDAFGKTKTQCLASAGEEAKLLKDSLKDLMKTVREKYTADKQNIEKVGDLIKPLIEKRKEAIKKAQDEFKAELEAGKTGL